jgi:hypothetical protein
MLAFYRLRAVSTDFEYIPPNGSMSDDPSYVRHELFAGVEASF